MTSSIDAWNERYSLERVRLPADINELEIICCESDVRTVSHIGIELENCVFNNSTLQQLRRRVAPGAKTTVQLRYNPALMNRIWVEDPVTHERFEVLNTDPVSRDLSAKQVAAIVSLHRKSQSTSTIVTRAQARKQIVDLYRPLLLAKTMTERRRAFKILGLLTNEELPHKPPKAAPKKRQKKQAAQTTASVAQTTESKTADHVDLPIQLNVVVSPVASPPVFKIVRQDTVHYASKPSNQEISNDGSH